MSNDQETSESTIPGLMLFVTGNAPRSKRARSNLSNMLESLNKKSIEPLEIDLLDHPEHTEKYSVFATPALLRTDDGSDMRVLYGDLSNESKLRGFLKGLGE